MSHQRPSKSKVLLISPPFPFISKAPLYKDEGHVPSTRLVLGVIWIRNKGRTGKNMTIRHVYIDLILALS